MRRLAAVVATVAVLACGAARGRGAAGADGTPFTATSYGASFGIQARLTGSFVVRDRWVYLVVPTGAVRTYQRDRQDYWDLRLRAGLATCQGADFAIVSEGRATRLLPLLGLSRDSASLDTVSRSFRDTLRLDVGLPPGTDPRRSWLAVVFEWPFSNAMATYTLHNEVPLSSASPWTGQAASIPGERCR